MIRLLADTQILVWALDEFERLPAALVRDLENVGTEPWFSVVSIWEIAIKSRLPRANLRADAGEVRRTLLGDGWRELAFSGDHAVVAGSLPLLHGDPFDRALVAQAKVEGLELVTSDRRLSEYPASVRLI